MFVTYATLRQWTLKFGQAFANTLPVADHPYLWRAVDQDGYPLDILVLSRRDQKAVQRLFRKLIKGLRHVPRVIVTNKLKRYGRPSAQFCRASSTGNTRASTTGLNCCTSPLGKRRGRCGGSSHRAAGAKIPVGSSPPRQPVSLSPPPHGKRAAKSH